MRTVSFRESKSWGRSGVGHCLQVDSTELGMEEMEAFWRRNRKAFRSPKFVDASNETILSDLWLSDNYP